MKTIKVLFDTPKFSAVMKLQKEYHGTSSCDKAVDHTIEEFSELIKEFMKAKRGRDNKDLIKEEFVDCIIQLECLGRELGYTFANLVPIIEFKLDKWIKNISLKKDRSGK